MHVAAQVEPLPGSLLCVSHRLRRRRPRRCAPAAATTSTRLSTTRHKVVVKQWPRALTLCSDACTDTQRSSLAQRAPHDSVCHCRNLLNAQTAMQWIFGWWCGNALREIWYHGLLMPVWTSGTPADDLSVRRTDGGHGVAVLFRSNAAVVVIRPADGLTPAAPTVVAVVIHVAG